MALLLHLTDLHLGKAPDTQDYGDYSMRPRWTFVDARWTLKSPNHAPQDNGTTR